MDYRLLNPCVRFAMRARRNTPYEETVCAYDHRLFYPLANSCALLTEGLRRTLTPGDLAVLPPGLGYRLDCEANAPCTFVIVNFDLDAERYGEEPIAPVSPDRFEPALMFSSLRLPPFERPFLARGRADLRQRLETLCDLMQTRPNLYRDRLSALLKDALLLALDWPAPEGTLLSEVRRYLDVNFTLPLTNAMVGKRFGYHPYYLDQMFSAGFGQSMHAYLIEKRIRCAQQLLLTTDRSVSAIAAECGFEGASWFSECFKKRTGASPSDFRKSCR